MMKNELLGEYDAQVADALFCMAEVNSFNLNSSNHTPSLRFLCLLR